MAPGVSRIKRQELFAKIFSGTLGFHGRTRVGLLPVRAHRFNQPLVRGRDGGW